MKQHIQKIVAIILAFTFVLLGGGNYLLHSFHQRQLGHYDGPGHVHAEDQKWTCGMHPMVISDEPGSCPICSMDLTPLKSGIVEGDVDTLGERKIKYWVAPMDATYIRNEPGKSPMGMDLVPVYEGQASSGSVIRIDPVTIQNMGVRTDLVERRSISRQISTVGLVDYEEPHQYSVNTKIAGWIERLHVAETGKMVKKGDRLLEIYSPELVSSQHEFLLALQNKVTLEQSPFAEIGAGAGRLLAAARTRLKLWDISDRQIKELETTGQVKKTLTLYAPYNGIVTMKLVNEGAYVKSGQELFQISDISSVWVNAEIYEYEIPWVKQGQQATVELPYTNGDSLTGEVTFIYPYVDAKTRTVKARIEFDSPGLELKPNMYVNVALQAETIKDALTIPVEAVLDSGDKQTVFVALGKGKFEPRQIKSGMQDGNGFVEVKQGLFEGEAVVTSAQFMLDSESQLREAIRKMLEPKKDEKPGGSVGVESDEGADNNLDDLF